MQDLRETLDACCEDDTDREILRLREEGYVDREIANRLGLPLTTCYVMRRTMYARFLELTGWRGEA
jgi:DNA-directed RNA polymerase specialized sigma24 family protein